MLLFALEQILGKLNPSAIYLAIFSSPIMSYFFTVFGFPIRLKLSKISADLLSFLGMDVSNEGNNILINGQYLEVEPACMGLKMMIVGVVICLAMITFTEQKQKKYFSFIQIGFIILVTIALLIASNLGRLILLIFFQIGQDGLSHQALGILSLIFYGLLPMYFLIPFLNKYMASPKKELVEKAKIPKPIPIIIMLAILSLMVMHKANLKNFIAYKQEVTTSKVELQGFKSELVGFGATKLLSDDALIYIKPCKNFWGLEHTPMICWKGSGYKLSKEKIIEVADQEIYTAELSQEENLLYTAWWYSNKETKTISQFHWRSEMAKGAPAFKLVNVSAETKGQLEVEVGKVLAEF
jgi:exosortase N